MRTEFKLICCAVGIALCGPASHATTFIFPFTTPAGSNGTSAQYIATVGGSTASLTATALITNSSLGGTPNLFDKNGGTDENGLGLTLDPSGDNEIVSKDAIILDFSAITNVSAIYIQMGSVQGGSGDSWSLYGSNTKPTTNVSLAGESGQTAIFTNQTTDQASTNTWLQVYSTANDPTLFRYYTVTEGGANGNVLLGGIEVVGSPNGSLSTPEPASVGLMGAALCGLALLGKKLRRP